MGPSVRLGKPKNAQDYRLENIQGVDTYIPVDFVSPFPLNIVLQSTFGIKSLHIEGWRLV